MSVNYTGSMPVEILAAGGLVWIKARNGHKVAVIERHQPKDVSLPKGKLKKGETFRAAALREVEEEIGCKARITSFAGPISYEVKGTPKIVLFWNMVPEDESLLTQSTVKDDVRWLAPREAFKQLSYQEQKNLLAAENPLRKTFTLRWLFIPWLSKLRHQRLSGSLQAYHTELNYRIQAEKNTKRNDILQWTNAAYEFLDAAKIALNKGDIDTGWKLLKAAQRMEIFLLEPSEVEAKAEALRCEAFEKLSGWRQNAIDRLLQTSKDNQQIRISKASLYQATLIRDERSDNTYHKIGLLRNQIKLLFFILTIAISLLLLLAGMGHFSFAQDPLTGSWETYCAVMLFGVIGGTVSGAISIAKMSLRRKITEQIADYWITLMRISIGAASALAIYALLQSAIFSTIFSSELTSELTSSGTVFFLAFVAGFSERLVQRAVESILSKE